MNYEQMMSLIVQGEGLHAQNQAELKRQKTYLLTWEVVAIVS
jgi:hypothetical protein